MVDRKKYPMKRRRYGWGWVPTTWQSWLFLSLQLAIVLAASSELPPKPQQPTAGQAARFFVITGAAVATLITVSTMVGPKPRWRWGKKATDNPEEDF